MRGNYFKNMFIFRLLSLLLCFFFSPEGFVLGFCKCACNLKRTKIRWAVNYKDGGIQTLSLLLMPVPQSRNLKLEPCRYQSTAKFLQVSPLAIQVSQNIAQVLLTVGLMRGNYFKKYFRCMKNVVSTNNGVFSPPLPSAVFSFSL